MRSFVSEGSATPVVSRVVEQPTYLLPRDEDFENTFHSTADFMNMMLVDLILRNGSGRNSSLLQQWQVVLFDRFAEGPYKDLIQRALSPQHPLLRHTDYGSEVALFKQLIFHLESPAALIFPEVAVPDPLTCFSTGLFHEYRKLILTAFNLWKVPPPEIPFVLLSVRHRTPLKNVGRILANEKDVLGVLREGNMIRLKVVDSAALSFEEQLRSARTSNVIIGVHGAGLMHILFAAEEAVLLEIHPSYRQDRHFRHAARMAGKIYLPMRSTQRETCVGTSENYSVLHCSFY